MIRFSIVPGGRLFPVIDPQRPFENVDVLKLPNDILNLLRILQLYEVDVVWNKSCNCGHKIMILKPLVGSPEPVAFPYDGFNESGKWWMRNNVMLNDVGALVLYKRTSRCKNRPFY